MSEEQPHCECGETTNLLHDCDRKEREAECPCALRAPSDYDGPMEDCPQHGRCPVQSTDGRRCLKGVDHRDGRWPDDPHDFADERRERYAAAIGQFFDQEYSELLALSAADAAMAVADEEIQRERENTAFANEHADRFYERATAAEDENARLRAELESLHRAAEFADIRREESEATIARVRSLRKHGPVLTWDEINAALEGEQ